MNRSFQFLEQEGNVFKTKMNKTRTISVAVFGVLFVLIPFVSGALFSSLIKSIIAILGVFLLAFAYDDRKSIVTIDKDKDTMIARKTNFYPFKTYPLNEFHHLETTSLRGNMGGYLVRAVFRQNGKEKLVDLMSFAPKDQSKKDEFIAELKQLLED